jgi:hypothetical protein
LKPFQIPSLPALNLWVNRVNQDDRLLSQDRISSRQTKPEFQTGISRLIDSTARQNLAAVGLSDRWSPGMPDLREIAFGH